MSSPLPQLVRAPDRVALIAELRRQVSAIEGLTPEPDRVLAFGVLEIDAHLSGGGLSLGALHEAAPESYPDGPAAFGFVVALAARIARIRDGAVLMVSERRGLFDFGLPYGPGLCSLGLDPARLILVEAGSHEDALWAIEEILRAGIGAGVIGCLSSGLGLKESRRLHLAAAGNDSLLMILRPHDAEAANAAASRWTIAAAPAGRDRFGLIDRWGWRLSLARARNGRPGAWRVEYDHGASGFCLARELADPALPGGAEERPPAPRLRAG